MKKTLLIMLISLVYIANLCCMWGHSDFTENNEKLYSDSVTSLFFYDTTEDSDGGDWCTNTSALWYQEPQIPNDDFIGETIDSNRWIEFDINNYLNQNNNLHYYKPATTEIDSFHYSVYQANWELAGDFDVQIDFNLDIWNSSYFQRESSVRLEFYIDDDNQCKLWRYRHTNDNYWVQVWDDGVFHDGIAPESGPGNEYNGKLRITRDNYVLQMWRWSNTENAWKRVYYYTGFSTANGHIKICFTNYYTEMEAEVDNFVVNEGITSFPLAGSKTRGTKKRFPEKAILVRTTDSIEILDVNDKSLWMRFTGIPDNLGTIGGNGNFIAAKNGVIYTTWSNQFQGLTTIDFNQDVIKYLSADYNQEYTGSIMLRNHDCVWPNITPPVNINSNQLNDISIFNDNSNEFIGFASADGVVILKNMTQSFHSQDTDFMSKLIFSENGKLYYSKDNYIRNCGYLYEYDNFSYLDQIYLSGTQSLESSDDFLFVNTSTGVEKIDLSPFVHSGTTYTNLNCLAPETSNNCVGSVNFGDTLYVASTGSEGAISIVDISDDTYLGKINQAYLVSNNCNNIAGSETTDYNRNLILGTNAGATYLYGETGNIPVVSIDAENDKAKLSWNQIIPATQYNIYRSENPYFAIGNEYLLDTTNNTYYIDYFSNKEERIQYFYKVTWE